MHTQVPGQRAAGLMHVHKSILTVAVTPQDDDLQVLKCHLVASVACRISTKKSLIEPHVVDMKLRRSQKQRPRIVA